MISRLQILWRRRTHMGITEDMPEELRKRIIFANGISTIFAFSAAPFIVSVAVYNPVFWLGMIAVAVNFLLPLLNKIGHHLLARTLMGLHWPLSVFLGSFFLKWGPGAQEVAPYLGLASYTLTPFLLFSTKEWKPLLLCVVVALGCYVSYEPLKRALDVAVEVQPAAALATTEWFVRMYAPAWLILGTLYLQSLYLAKEKRNEDLIADLNQTVAALRDTQEQLMEQEKMSAFGKFVRNMAHELNSPLGVILSSSKHLQHSLATVFRDLEVVLGQLPPQVQPAFSRMLERALAPEQLPLTSRQRRTLQREIQDKLKAEGLESMYRDDLHILAALRMDQYPDDMLQLLHQPGARHWLPQLHQAQQLAASSQLIHMAAKDISQLVMTVRTMVDGPSNAEHQPVQVASAVEEALTSTKNVMLENIQLSTDVPPFVALHCNREELVYMLMNLIENASQAQQTRGSICICTTATDNYIDIAVKDCGPGIPPELMDQVCKPFFTTLPNGQGCGMGLYVTDNMMRNIGGQVVINSTPGNTEVILRFPSSLAVDAGWQHTATEIKPESGKMG